jgi:hypothetical protein
MSQTVIGVGATANDGTGDPLRTAFQTCNANFAELYARINGASSDALVRPNSNFPEETYYPCTGPAVYPLVSGTPNVGRYTYCPFVLAQTTTIDKLAFAVTSSVLNGKSRVGLYNCDQTTLKPTTLIVDAGEVETASGNGVRGVAVSAVLTAGVVYCSAYVAGTASAGVIAQTQPTSIVQPALGYWVSGSSLGVRVGWKVDAAYAALAADVSASSFLTSQPGEAPPIVFYRVLAVA